MKRWRSALAGAALLAATTAGAGAAAPMRPDVPHVLAFSQTLGFRHISVDHSKEVLASLAREGGFTVEFTEDPRFLTAAKLKSVDVVLWLHNTAARGDERASPFTDAQEQSYGRWMACGGGHVGVHAAVDSYSPEAFPEYFAVTGAIIAGHPLTATSILDDQDREHEGWGEPEAEIRVHDQRSPMTRPWWGSETFRMKDEYYKLDRDPAKTVKDYRLLLSLERFTDPQATVTSHAYPGAFPEQAPLAWTGSFRGKNRSFYTNLGHSVATWDDGDFQRHLVNGIAWVSEKRPDARCVATSTTRTR